MTNIKLSKQFSFIALVFVALFFGCKRNNVADDIPSGEPVNDATQVTASVSGIVLDETNTPIANAVVTSGAANTTTNANGMFIFNNISLSKENGSITAVKAGYFKGVRSFKTIAGKNNAVRLQLMQKTLSGSVTAATGGIINANGNATINFPANAFVTNTGAAYTGAVKVYSRWIAPTASNLGSIIPGDLRGLSTNGTENILTTYGMVGAELEDASGNVLKIAAGKKATVSFPIPTSLSASAPASIVLWHFDDATARWKENGTATKTGSAYTAEVDKFSFWNCDVGSINFINLDYTLINAATNTPLVNTSTRIKRISNGTYGYGITNNTGFVSGPVPSNEALVLEVVSTICNTVIYSKNIGPFTSNTSLGNINVTLPASQYINFSGTVLNCAGAPVSNGYLSFYGAGGNNAFVSTSTTGSFAFTILNCSGGSLAYNYQAVNYDSAQQSALIFGTATNGIVNMGTILACGNSSTANVYVVGTEENASGINIAKLWKNGVATNLSNGHALSVFVSGSDVYCAIENYGTASLWKNGNITNLPFGTFFAFANSVFVSGTDVFVVGQASNNSTANTAKIWKNGVITSLTNGTYNAIARSIYVSGTDVFVTGEEENPSGIRVAKLWKNGVTTNLTNGIYNAFAKSVYVFGNDVYVAGEETNSSGNNVAKVWKNGVPTILTSGALSGNANSVFVSGNDVYVAGEDENFAVIWKNGIVSRLSPNANANSIFVSGNDIYVAGYQTISSKLTAVIWKNGISTKLTNSSFDGIASSVFVK
jgi:hypothetical protein